LLSLGDYTTIILQLLYTQMEPSQPTPEPVDARDYLMRDSLFLDQGDDRTVASGWSACDQVRKYRVDTDTSKLPARFSKYVYFYFLFLSFSTEVIFPLSFIVVNRPKKRGYFTVITADERITDNATYQRIPQHS